jgi:hypothetical protein
VSGTDDGTFDDSISASDGDDEDTITSLVGTDVTQEIGTTTIDDHVVGTVTDGIYTNELVGTVAIAVEGTETRTEVGTESGIFV